jgi:GNAT superfamily N-acetyltransferase
MELTREAFERAALFLREQARPLERALFAHTFEGATPDDALAELAKFANEDGGFGNGLEPDFLVPDSSALATSHALMTLRELDQPASNPLVAGALAWLVDHFEPEIAAWRAVPPAVDDHPHANHWSWPLHAPGGGWPVAVIPCAEVLSHFHHYAGSAPKEQLTGAGDALIAALAETATGPDGVLYLDRLARTQGIPAALRDALAEHLPRLALEMLNRDPEAWSGYVANPLKLAPSPESSVAPAFAADVETNLDWAIEHQLPDGSWAPNWSWQGAYPAAWEASKRAWQGILTLERLQSLRAWGRLAS